MKFTYQGNEYRLILFTIAGSRFYGTHYEKGEHPFKPDYVSDTDYRGIFIANPDTKLGLTGKIDEIEVKKTKDGIVPVDQQKLINELNNQLGIEMSMDEDLTLYEVKKFITLALENNPNIMDIIFTDDEATIYKDEKGEKLLSNGKDIFMSTKTKFTFSGYAMSQLKRVKGHNRWITKYPKTPTILTELKNGFIEGEIDYNWITDYFGGSVSAFVTGMTQQKANKLPKIKSLTWNEFITKHAHDREQWLKDNVKVANKNDLLEMIVFRDDWNSYRKPQLIDYVYPKNLKGKKLSLDDDSEFDPEKFISIREFLTNYASFRTISKTQYNIFSPPNSKFSGGIFAREGALKAKDPEEVGTFFCQLTVDDMNYKKDLDNIQKLWEWKTKRNEKRSVLEEHFGYDVKHVSHLFRLLIGVKNILKTNEYNPRLTGKNLKFVKDILNGQYSYDWVIKESEKMCKELERLYKKSKLPKTPDHKKANQLLLELSREM